MLSLLHFRWVRVRRLLPSARLVHAHLLGHGLALVQPRAAGNLVLHVPIGILHLLCLDLDELRLLLQQREVLLRWPVRLQALAEHGVAGHVLGDRRHVLANFLDDAVGPQQVGDWRRRPLPLRPQVAEVEADAAAAAASELPHLRGPQGDLRGGQRVQQRAAGGPSGGLHLRHLPQRGLLALAGRRGRREIQRPGHGQPRQVHPPLLGRAAASGGAGAGKHRCRWRCVGRRLSTVAAAPVAPIPAQEVHGCEALRVATQAT
mmetsp:Transcript_81343/g.228108  ORF Transcript_81343/g.228108 Transcript_81343/m.228108 type:complete len:261 (-) Transcript_81343:79-861(-)